MRPWNTGPGTEWDEGDVGPVYRPKAASKPRSESVNTLLVVNGATYGSSTVNCLTDAMARASTLKPGSTLRLVCGAYAWTAVTS